MIYASAVFVFLAGILVQWMWATYLPIWDLAPQVLLIMTVAVAARSGAVTGQCFGFAWGLFLDLLSAHVFGANALAFTLAAYLVGALRRQMDVASPAPQLALTFLVTPAYFLLLGLTGRVFEHQFLWVGWKAFLLNPFYNCLVAPFLFEFVRKFVHV